MLKYIPILRETIGIASDWLEGRRRIQQARVDSQVKIEEAKATAEVNWDQVQAQNSGSSWKDEYWTIIFSIPLILAFIPSFTDTVLRGFEAVERMPDWYVTAVLALVGASVGIRKLMDIRR